jgi:glyoxylase-like metal-dependent hydrolase (beta-lactamase superfamily II)
VRLSRSGRCGRTIASVVEHVTASAAVLLDRLPDWVRLVRADNPGPMTLEGTNTWILRPPGATVATVIDPGPALPAHLVEVAGHRPFGTVLITHGHPDHTDGLPGFARLCPGVPVGELDAVGAEVTALATPGHTADSVCFLVTIDGQRVIFTGDTILGRGTTVVAWPDGRLGDYLVSLRRLAGLDGVAVLPGHGPALADCAAAARFYLDHRLARLDQIQRARSAGAQTAADVVAVVYAEVDRSLWPAAEWSVRAQLAFLAEQAGDERARESDPASTRLDPP